MNCPSCDSPLKTKDGCSCGWRATPQKRNGSPYLFGIQPDTAYAGSNTQQSKFEWVDKQCAWHEDGVRCEKYGHMAETTNGAGPWFCRDDFSKLRSWDKHQ